MLGLRNLQIVKRSDEAFRNRQEAGKLLGQELKKFKTEETIVLGIPRGGMVVAQGIAQVLGTSVDIVLSRKLGAPYNPELAIGAVSENGSVYINKNLAERVGADQRYIQEEKENQLKELNRRAKIFREICPKISLEDRIVVITDDGIATGATMEAALWSVRQEHPKKTVVAVPVGPRETLEQLAHEADEVICLRLPSFLGAISQFYLYFEQVSDTEVREILINDRKDKK